MENNHNADSIYFQNLKFDQKLKETVIAFLIRNSRFLIVITMLIIGIGFYSLVSLPREISPDVNIPMIIVSDVYPGASPSDIEELVIKPLEDKINTIRDIDKIESTASQNIGTIIVTFKSGVDVKEALSNVKDKVDLVSLPDEAQDPIVQERDFTHRPVLDFLLVGKMDSSSLGKIAKVFKDELEDLSIVSEVETSGVSDEQIKVNLNLEKLQAYGISPADISQLLKANDINFPPGEININGSNYQVSIDSTFKSPDDVRNQYINIKGDVVPLTDVADIRIETAKFKDPVTYQEPNQEKMNAVELRVYKTTEVTIDAAIEEIQKEIDTNLKGYEGLKFVVIENRAEKITDSFSSLLHDMQVTIILVFIVLLLFLGIKEALTASFSVPLTMLITVIVMQMTGLSINSLSLFALLLGLGLFVDDNIVIVSAYTSYMKSGKFTPVESGLLVYKDFLIPIFASTITTIWAFLPLLFTTGIIGEFIKSIPIIVSTSLFTSTAIAVFLNIPFLVILNKTKIPYRVKALIVIILAIIVAYLLAVLVFGDYFSYMISQRWEVLDQTLLIYRSVTYAFSLVVIFAIASNLGPLKDLVSQKLNIGNSKKVGPIAKAVKEKVLQIFDRGLVDFTRLVRFYRKILGRLLFSKTRSIVFLIGILIFVLISFSLLPLGLLKSVFFPGEDSEILYVNIEGPSGWEKDMLRESVEKAEAVIKGLPELKSMTTTYGYNMNNEQRLASNSTYAYIIVKLIDEDERKRDSDEIGKSLREPLKNAVSLKTSVFTPAGGPPAGADIQVNIAGEDFVELEKIANNFADVIRNEKGAVNVATSLKQTPGQIQIVLKPSEMSKRGVTSVQVASWLRTFIEGSEIGEIGSGKDETKILLTANGKTALEKFENLIVPSATGGYSLSEIADIRLQNNPEKIERLDGKRLVKVTAGAEDIAATELYSKIKPKISEIKLNDGYTWTVGGANEQNQKSIMEILQLMVLSFFLIFFTMVLQYNSFRKSFLILLIIPFGVAGVFFVFTIFGIPLSFPSLIGIMALFGILIYNAGMVVDRIVQVTKMKEIEFTEGIIDVCASRVEPILFTTLTSVVGLLPITISDPLWRGLGGAIIAGLSVSFIASLFILPVLYKLMFQGEKHYEDDIV